MDKTQAEFEMLVHVLSAINRIKNALDWSQDTNAQNHQDLRGARGLLEGVRDRCSEENQRLADHQVNG